MSEGLEIPWQKLSEDALQGLLEELATRDGTDYGEVECTLDEKVAAIRQALTDKVAVIAFDPASETWSLQAR